MTASDPYSQDASSDLQSPPPASVGGVQAAADHAPEDPLGKALAEAAEMKDAWMRARAETDNVRRQAQADVAKAYKYAIEKFAGDLLAVKDALEQTLVAKASVSAETLRAGAELTLKSLAAAFARAGISEIDPVGQKFDPHSHQAMQAVESDQAPNTVVTVFQKGYLINDRVLRPALVTVARARESGSGVDTDTDTDTDERPA
ncbi:MAG: nucleotide exchange factor GrpE [Betaproteobacteria bacterium]|nr:nucleotide exchange factor GrpE [Betaproteobacteria bacterium]